MINNLDQIIEGFQKWFQNDPHKESEDFYPQLRTKEFLSGLARDEFIEFFFQFARIGGKIQSGGYRTAGNFKKAIEEKFNEFREFILEPYHDDFDVNRWLNRIEDFNGFGQGISTIYLNRINKNRFIVVNNKSREALSLLGYKIKSDILGGYHTIEAAQKDLLTRFPALDNYFRADALTHFLIGTDEGRRFLSDPVSDLVEKYKQIKGEIGHKDEFYKYELVRFFQDKWPPDENTLAGFIKEFLKLQDNLMYNLASSSLTKITGFAPKETLLLFHDLFNESKNLDQRILDFQKNSDELIKRFEPELKGNQDERAISVFLTCMYPDKYTFYKNSYYSAYCRLLQIKEKPAGKKYKHYLQLIDNLKQNYLNGNTEILSLTNKTLPKSAWQDKSLNILAQDLLYITFRESDEINYWIFQGNPEHYDISGALRDNVLKTWSVNAHKQRIKPGDKVILWATGEKSGCYALCEITSKVAAGKDSAEEFKYYTSEPENNYGDKVSFRVENNLWNAYVSKERLLELPEFENFKAGNRGTNFEATKEQYDAIKRFIQVPVESVTKSEKELIDVLRRIQDEMLVRNYFDKIVQLLKHLRSVYDDSRLAFNTPSDSKTLSVTINQRYIIHVSKDLIGFTMPGVQKDKFEAEDDVLKTEPFKPLKGETDPPVYVHFKKESTFSDDTMNLWFQAAEKELLFGSHSSYSRFDNQAYRRTAFDQQYREHILLITFSNSILQVINDPEPEKMRKNQILFGPPGTGKTYKTINKALEIILGKEFVNENDDNRENLIREFNRLKEAGQIEFVTFHQSFSYEDFVEGIKPVMLPEEEVEVNDGVGDIRYEIRDGIFKKICSRAKGVSSGRRSGTTGIDFDKASYYKMSIGGKSKPHIHDWCIKNNKLAMGWGGDADHNPMKSYVGNWNSFRNEYRKRFPDLVNESKYHIQAMYLFLSMKKGDIVMVSKGNKIIDAIGVIQSDTYIFDDTRDFGYCQFREVEWLATDMHAAPELFVKKNLMMQSIYQFYTADINKEYFKREFSGTPAISEKEKYVLIIDEINRGNVASIFGELITLIEEDKRIGAGNQLLVRLPYSGSDAESFGVPDNVYIIGTMNTADRSIEALDTALRRRFSFEEMSPDPALLKSTGKLAPEGKIADIDVVRMLNSINNRIEKLIDKDHKIGHSYFMNIEPKEESLKQVFKDKVIPLLEEYFYGDFGKIGLVLGSSFVEKVNSNGFQFAAFPDYDDLRADLMEKQVFRIKPTSDWDFKSIYS